MSLPVIVTMRSRVELYENGIPTGEEMASGILRSEGELFPDSGRLCYTERGEGGDTAVTLSFPEKRDTLTVERSGASVARFTLTHGRPFPFTYAVPPFSFPAEATLLSLDNRITARGGTLAAVYRMMLGGQEERISLHLLITPKEEHAT